MLRAAAYCSQLDRWVQGLPVALCVHLIIAFISACGLSRGYNPRAASLGLLVVVLNSDMLKIVLFPLHAYGRCGTGHGWGGEARGWGVLAWSLRSIVARHWGKAQHGDSCRRFRVRVSLVCQCYSVTCRVVKSAMQDKAPNWQEKLLPPQIQPCSTPLCCPSSARALNDIGMLMKKRHFCCDSLLGSRRVKAMNLLIYFWVNISLVWMTTPFKPFVGEMNFGPERKKCVTLGMRWGGKGQGFYARVFSIPLFQEGILQLTESSMHVLCFCSDVLCNVVWITLT